MAVAPSTSTWMVVAHATSLQGLKQCWLCLSPKLDRFGNPAGVVAVVAEE
eukprot:CAMPEP_0206614186 /NCGR_PEP_ID=MMETSP0325_2-20121206/57211_1 /ASSEMBLY_ACC=CAM_ASM_000347 /TAXON_ID=2866 /ORGANISM="Crypthecodinium cohnii, Strain Seligo" /LENGTH=49 /DNA_ID= /DNA_START= /DNA_END= /DNA_ORIENTATION=